MNPAARCDLAILGAGSGGYAAALRAAQLGLSVTLVEQGELGGTCLHRGCIPAKALLHSAAVAETVRSAGDFGVAAELGEVDLAAIQTRTREVIEGLHRGLTGLIAQRGITVVRGTGRLLVDGNQHGIEVSTADDSDPTGQRTHRIWARRVVLATGSSPRDLDLPVDGKRIITSDQLWTLPELPATAIVLGGGVIGVEIASAWAGLGVQVTLLEAAADLLPTEEPALRAGLRRGLRQHGIQVHTRTPVESATASDGQVEVLLADGETLSAELLLVAVGRAPRVADSGAEQAGLRTERGWLVVDEHLTTSRAGVFAVGDLVEGPQLAHRGFTHGLHVAEWVAHLDGRTRAPLALPPSEQFPRVVFSHPEVASIGLTSDQARARGITVRTARHNLAGNGRSRIVGASGEVIVVAESDGAVLGVHMIGNGVGELISEAQLITGWEALPEEVGGMVHAHPTQSEALGEAMLALAGRPLHTHS